MLTATKSPFNLKSSIIVGITSPTLASNPVRTSARFTHPVINGARGTSTGSESP